MNKIQTIIDLIRGKLKLKLQIENRMISDKIYYDKFNGLKIPFMKANSIENNCGLIENIILGSSHGVYGYIPEQNEFNLCFPSQDLYYSFSLYEKFRGKCPNLKNIILFYSVFSAGFDLAKSSEKWRCLCYKDAFNINSIYENVNKLSVKKIKSISKKKQYQEIKNLTVSDFYRGENIDIEGLATFKNAINSYPAKERAFDHLKFNVKYNNLQNIYLKKLIELIKENNGNLYIVIPLMQAELVKWLPDLNIIMTELFDISKQNNLKILNFYQNNDFGPKDFFDYDHLNYSGARKLTALIKNKMI